MKISKKNKTNKNNYGKVDAGVVDGIFSYQWTLTLDQFGKRSQIPANDIIKYFLMNESQPRIIKVLKNFLIVFYSCWN